MDHDAAAAAPERRPVARATAPLVTVLIPARNESGDIGRCLSAVIAQDLPAELVEVVVATADSTDDTAALAKELLDGVGFSRVEVLVGGPGTTPVNLNAGLAAATGTYLCRVDARSIIPTDYVRRCVELLESRPDVAVTGGAQVAVARDTSDTAVGIARALNNRWGMGLSKYRSGAASGPTDTVYLGAFRTEQLRAAGGWDERFATNQDFELNRRMGRQGLVWFESGLDVEYLPRRTVGELFQQYRRFGSWKVVYWTTTDDRPRPRQLLLLGLVPAGLVAGCGWFAMPRRLKSVLAALGLTGAVVFDAVGSRPSSATVRARLVGLLASGAVAAGWSWGAWGGLLRSGRSRGSDVGSAGHE